MDRKTVNLVTSLLSAFVIVAAGISPDLFSRWSGLARISLFALLAVLQVRNDNVIEFLAEVRRNIQLQEKNKQLKDNVKRSSKQFNELREVMASFLEHSDIYRDKVKNHLQLNEDYLCIVKSSEGLSAVFQNMDEKSQLPFTRVLSSFAGAVKPFERMGIFMIPIKSLPNFRGRSLRKYVDRVIIPKVQKERTRFLARLSPKLRRQAEEFSYKYIAFLVSRGNIAHDVRNRKFNQPFNTFLVEEQIGRDLENLRTELSAVVKTKDLLQLVNWSAFVSLNNEQEKLIERYQHRIYETLSLNNLASLTTLADIQPEGLFSVIWPIVRRSRDTSPKKIQNLCIKVVEGAAHTVKVLRDNGISF